MIFEYMYIFMGDSFILTLITIISPDEPLALGQEIP